MVGEPTTQSFEAQKRRLEKAYNVNLRGPQRPMRLSHTQSWALDATAEARGALASA